MSKKVYLCGPINARSDEDCINWRNRAKELLEYETLDPMRRDYRGKEAESVAEIVENDIKDIQECSALLVYYDQPSVGTSMEVLLAHQMGKPIVLVDASDKPLSPWLMYHVDFIAVGLEVGCDHVGEVLEEMK
jgi:nucleoside 2-deoxyribosyltransferase